MPTFKAEPPSSARNIDFDHLTLKDALDLAILVEEEARDRYEELAAQLILHHTPAAASFFTLMTLVEEKHRVALQEKRTQAFGNQRISVSAEMLYDVEAPEYDEARAFMSLEDALKTAMRSEIKAHAFFVRALACVTDPEVKSLFTELCEEEVEHQRLVQKELDKLAKTPADGGNTNDYGDPPVSL